RTPPSTPAFVPVRAPPRRSCSSTPVTPVVPGRTHARPGTSRLLLLVVDDLGIDDVVGLTVAAGRRAARSAIAASAGSGIAGALVERLAGLLLGLHERVERAVDPGDVIGLERLLDVVDRPFHGHPVGRVELVAGVLDELLGRVDRLVGTVARLDLLTPLLVFGGMRLGFAHHAVDLFLRE